MFNRAKVITEESGETGFYAIFDRVAQEFTPPFFCTTDALAVRQFKRALGDDPFVSDYALYEIGRYKAKEGVLIHNNHREVPTG